VLSLPQAEPGIQGILMHREPKTVILVFKREQSRSCVRECQLQCSAWHRRILDVLSVWLIFPVAGLYTASKHQSLGCPDLQAFHSRTFLVSLSRMWNELPEDVATVP